MPVRLFKVAAATIAIITLAGCSAFTGRGSTTPEIVRSVTETTLPPPTAPPQRQATPPDPNSQLSMEFAHITRPDCDFINAAEVSSLIPSNWDEWCRGVFSFAIDFEQLSAWEANDICEVFWEHSDQFLFGGMVDSGSNPDHAIGAIDALWWVC